MLVGFDVSRSGPWPDSLRRRYLGNWGPDKVRPFASGYWFDANLIVHCFTKLLFASQVALCCLYGHVPQQELNLFQFAISAAAKGDSTRLGYASLSCRST